jgi:hypothetical protein
MEVDKRSDPSSPEYEFNVRRPANHKAQIFVEWYLKTHNLRVAAEKAGYKQPYQAGNRLIRDKKICSYIEHCKNEELKQVRLTKDDFLRQVARDLENAKSEATRARLRQLQADVLGFTRPQESCNNINIFQSLQDAQRFITTKLPEVTVPQRLENKVDDAVVVGDGGSCNTSVSSGLQQQDGAMNT